MHATRFFKVLAPVAALVASTTTVAMAQEEAAPAAEEDSGPTAWFRIDSDSLGAQLWAGATNKLGSIDLATDIYVVGTQGEFDIGPSFAIGDLALLPMVGVNFDWSMQQPTVLVAPQLFTIYDGDSPIYFESWIQGFFGSPFLKGSSNTLYTRDFLLFKATDDFRIGPQVEATIGLNDAGKSAKGKALASLPVGLRVNYNARGDWDSLIGAFVGYETQDKAQVPTGDPDSMGIPTLEDSKGIVGRLTYLHFF